MSATESRDVYSTRMAFNNGRATRIDEEKHGSPYCELAPHDMPSTAHRDAWPRGYRGAQWIGIAKAVRS